MRVSVGIHGDFDNPKSLELIKESYDLMSQKYFTHATPTLFNAGTPRPQLSSCYLIAMEDDSIDGIFNTLKDCALISKYSGGIGLHIHNIRAKGSHIQGTNGITDGIVPMLRVFNNTARYVNQSGKRNGSFAIYLEPWHPDIFDFLEMRKNHGDEELKARDLFYALWISDLFMERVKEKNGKWSLFCPHECPGLSDVYGTEFNNLYEKYEQEGKARKTVNARDLWFAILDAQMETGTPYLVYKDAANQKSNQKNLGTIKSSNLCVAPETLVLTMDGHKKIEELVGQNVDVWNGDEFSRVKIMKTGENQELIDVYTNDDSKLTCTKYHKFYIQCDNEIRQVEAKDLKFGDKLITCSFPVIDGDEPLPDVYSRGNIPPYNCSIKNKMKWLSQYCNDENNRVEMTQEGDLYLFENYPFLSLIKLFLQTCGINPCKYISTYWLTITSTDLCKLIKLGFSPKRNFDIGITTTNTKQVISIVDIKYNNRRDNTYCFTEPKRHMGIFNGIITGQCTEIIEYSDNKETAVCNLASIGLPTFVNQETKQFDYDTLHEVTKVVTNNLNKVIDKNYYPTEKTKRSNMRHRPIGIGVQGLADTFMLMDIPFYSDEAKEVNKLIFETIYHAALERSNEIAIERKQWILEKCSSRIDLLDMLNEYEYDALVNGTKLHANFFNDGHIGSYCSFSGSPASEGILQFDLWSIKPTERYNWTLLKESIKTHGLRNSLLVAPMPTASTSQILGFNECFEPFTSNLYSRKTLAGEFVVVNKYLMKELIQLGHWNEQIKNNIIANKGSIQQLTILPEHIRNKYKIVWEIPMKHIIDMAADRGPFICQSQSLNLWMEEPVYNKLTSMHFYAWSKGLKTGIYYLRRKAKHQAQQFTIEPDATEKNEEQEEICEMCSA